MPAPTMTTVTYHQEQADGTAWRTPLIFQLIPGSYEAGGLFPSSIVYGQVDVNGDGSIELWANEGGNEASRYRCILPSGEQFYFTVPTTGGPFTLSELRELGVTGADSQYVALASRLPTVLPEEFGAAGDGVADDTVAVGLAFATGRPVGGGNGSQYRITSTITAPAGDITIRNLKLRPIAALAGSGCFNHTAAAKATTELTSASLRVGGYVIDVTSTAGMAAGDLLILQSDEAWPYDVTLFKGEATRIASVISATQIRLAIPLFFAYVNAAEDVTVTVFESYRVEVDGLDIEYPSVVNKYGCGFNYFARGSIKNLRVKNAGQVGGSLVGCVGVQVPDADVQDCYMTGLGYGIQLNGCTGVGVTGGAFYRNRRGVDISGAYPSNGCKVNDNTGIGHPDEGSCFGGHATSNACSFNDNVCIGGLVGIQIRGPNTSCDGNIFIGVKYAFVWSGCPGFVCTNNYQPKEAARVPGSGLPDTQTASFLQISGADAVLWSAGIPNRITGNTVNNIDDFIYLGAEIAELKYTTIEGNDVVLEDNSAGNVYFMRSDALAPMVVHPTSTVQNNRVRVASSSVLVEFGNIVCATPALGNKTTRSTLASVGHAGRLAYTSMESGQTFTFTLETAAGASIIIADGSSGKAGKVFVSYASATVEIEANPDSFIEASAAPTAGAVGVFKNANSQVVSIKTNFSTRPVGVGVLGDGVSAVTAPV